MKVFLSSTALDLIGELLDQRLAAVKEWPDADGALRECIQLFLGEDEGPAGGSIPESGRASPLGVIEPRSASFGSGLQYEVLFARECNDVVILASKPRAERCNQKLERNHNWFSPRSAWLRLSADEPRHP